MILFLWLLVGAAFIGGIWCGIAEAKSKRPPKEEFEQPQHWRVLP